jgi:site-specific DNA-methyltransferase (adenine-specific)
MVLCDLPFGTTQNYWDVPIDLELLWPEYKRVIKDNGAILLFAQTPYDKVLGVSNLKMLRYEWIWEKNKATGFFNANKAPMKAHENILVFYKKLPYYNPIKTTGHKPVNNYKKHTSDGSNYGKSIIGTEGGGQTDRFPRDVLRFDVVVDNVFPTEKPVSLCEYFIRTYTREGETVLDNCAGSGSIGEAAEQCARHSILIEKVPYHCELIRRRMAGIETSLFEGVRA